MTDTQASLTLLRQAVVALDEHEKLALATFLVGTSNPSFPNLVAIPESDKDSTDLAEACELSSLFTPTARIFFAIELLEEQIDRDEFEESDRLSNSTDYEGEEYYASDRPALGEDDDSYGEEV